MSSFDRGEYDALYTFLEEILPTLTDPAKSRTCEFFMDRCENVIGQLRQPGNRLNSGRFSGILGDLK